MPIPNLAGAGDGKKRAAPDQPVMPHGEIVTPSEKIQTMLSIVDDINKILLENEINEKISLRDITITNETVSDLVKPEPKLSDIITNHLWPSITTETVYHYTSREAAESILSDGVFRLCNIANRYSEGEIRTFCETHNLLGCLALDENNLPKYRHMIMPNTFYASFTGTELTPEREEYFWKHFATSDSVRLKFDIVASNPNFRKMYYEQIKGKPIQILSTLTSHIREKHSREFVLKGISRLCSFYLSGNDYGIENEYRALYRCWEGFGPQPKGNDEFSYIELPLNVMNDTGYQLKITEVHAIEKPNMSSSYTFSKRKA